jgi:hypothetical protein
MSYSLDLVKGHSSMHDYKISRLFNIPFITRTINVTQEVHWYPPTPHVVKINFDGSDIGAHPCGAIGIVIRDSACTFLGAISSNIGHASAIDAEFSACMLAIEKARDLQLNQICLETDFNASCHCFQQKQRSSLEDEKQMAV